MDHAVGGASAATSEPEQERPGWWWTIGSLLLAYVLTVAALLLILLALSPLGVEPELILDEWPWRADGLWAAAAGLGLALPFDLLFALAARFVVEWRSDWKLRLAPLLAAALAASWLTRDIERGGEQNAGALCAFALLVVVMRYVAIRTSRGPSRPPLPLLLGGGAVAVLLVAVGLTYRPLHPLELQLGTASSGVEDRWGFDAGDGHRAVDFALDNASDRGVRIVGVRAETTGGPVAVQIGNPAEEFASSEMYVPLPAGGLPLAADGSDSADTDTIGRIRLPPGSCRDSGVVHRADVRGLVVAVETVGLTRTQRLRLDSPIVLRCP